MSKKVDIKRGSTVVAVGEGLEYHGEWMQHGYVTVTVKSSVKIDFQVGDYVVFRGEKFYLWGEESWKKQARSNSYGEAYVYENMKLWDSSILLEQVSFRDFVLNWDSDANVNTYSSLGKFSFFGADVDDLADRIQANIDRVALTIGSDNVRFKVLTPSEARSSQRCNVDHTIWNDFYNGDGESSKTDIVVNVDSETLWGGLARAYNDFGMTYFVDGQYIVIGAPATTISEYAFVYGKGHELKTIEQHVDDQQRIVTRLFAYGSTKNMPANYYANQFRKMGASYEKRVNLYDGTSYYFLDTNIPIKSVEKAFGWGRNGRDGRPEPDFGHQFPNRANMNVFCSIAPDDDPQADYEAQVWVLDDQQYGEKLSLLLTDSSIQNAFQTTGGTLYVVDGADINYWPASDVVELDGYLQNLAIQNLMLPGFPSFKVSGDELGLYGWMLANGGEVPDEDPYSDDPEKGTVIWEDETLIVSKNGMSPWIQSAKSGVYGVREGDVYFDGSGDMEEIYPTIANTGANSVQSAEGFDDHGYLDEGGTFTMQVLDSGIEWDKLYVNGMTISMTSGFCTGRDFTVDKKPVKANGSWTFTLTREQDERGCFLPNVDNLIESGDVFIVSGIELPAEYVEAASEALLRAAIAAIKENDEPKRTYTPSINNIYMAKDLQANGAKALHYKLRAGAAVAIQLDDAGTQDAEVIASVIDALTIKDDGGDGIATYEITLRDEKEKTLTQTISEAVSKGSGGGGGSAATSGRAYRLSDSTPRTAWGRQYWENGQPRDVSGNIDDAIDINMSGTLSIDGFEVSKDSDGRLMHDGDIYATGSVAALGYSAAGGGGSVVLGPLLAELNDEPMPVADGYLHWTGSAFEWVEPGGGGDVPGTIAWNNITGKPATFPPSEHNHDERYYISNGTVHLGDNSITPITSHQSLAAYTPTENYQALTIKGGTTVVGTYAPTQALTFSIVAGSNISVTADATNKKITIANTYSYTHPTGGANKTISAANGLVLSAITVNSLGHVTSVGSRTLGSADIPALDASKITSGTFGVARIPDLSNIYLLKVAGENNPITNSLYVGSTTNKGVYVKDPAGNYVPAFYQNGENLWIGSTQTLATHHRGQTYISAGYDGAHGNKTIYVCVPNDSNNGGTNYGVWHSGNDGAGSGLDADLLDGHDSGYFATTAALTALAGTVSTQGGRISTMEGYFDNGVANSAKRLSGTVSYTAWGQVYWQNGVPKGSFEGNLTVGTDNHISFKDSDGTARQVLDYEGEELWLGWGTTSEKASPTNIIGNGVYIQRKTDSSYEAVLAATADGNVGIGTTNPTEKLHVVGNIMATGAVSALGYSADGGGAAGATYLRELLDVNISGTPSAGQVLTFRNGYWIAETMQVPTPDLSAYATQQWVYDRSFAYSADLQDLYNYVGSTFVQSLGVSGDYVTWTKSGTTNQLTVPFATRASELRRNHISSGTLDANTMTIGGTKYAIAANYYSTDAWVNAPSGMSYGAVMELTAGSGVGVLSGQLAWDVTHNSTTPTRRLWWRARNSSGWSEDWKEIAFADEFLPLTAGSEKPLTGSLYFSGNTGINWADGAGMLACKPTSGWTGISSTQWGVGSLSAQGVIRSDNSDLLHYKNSASYTIWDSSNFRPGTEYTPWTDFQEFATNVQTNYATTTAMNTALTGYLPLTAGSGKPLTGILWMNADLVMANPNNTTNDSSQKIAFYTNKNYPNISPYIQAIYESSYGRKRLSVFQKNIADWNTPQTEVLSVMPDGKLRLTQAIAYKGTKATYDMITFIDNTKDIYGNGIAIGGGGMTVIGGGESAATIVSGWLAMDKANHYGGNEMMYIGNDGAVSIFTNLQGGWEYRKEFYFDADGWFWLPAGTGGRQVILHPDGQFQVRAVTGGWAYTFGAYTNAGSAPLGQFGSHGVGDSLTYMYIGRAYNDTWMTILPSGNVGIGTITPTEKLHVIGNILATGQMTANTAEVSNAAGGLVLMSADSGYLGKLRVFDTSRGADAVSFYAADGASVRNGLTADFGANSLKIGNGTAGWDYSAGLLKLTGGMYATGAIAALGMSSASGDAVVGSLTATGDMTVSGSVSFEDALDVQADVFVGDSLYLSGDRTHRLYVENGHLYFDGQLVK